MNRKTEVTIFFTALVMFGVVVVGGISYFKTQAEPDGLLADMTATIPSQATSSQYQATINTIPTSTIITPVAPAPSSTPLAPLTLPYSLSASTATSTYWPKAWGDISWAPESLSLIPDASYHGANSFLNGADAWSNYEVTANVSPLMGGWFDIVSRVANKTQNFVYCEFGSNGTEIIERVDGSDTQLAATSASTTDVVGATENFGMEVYGNDIGCTIANEEVVGTSVTNGDESPTGGIGFVIFGAPPEQKQVQISDIYVSAVSQDGIIVPFPVTPAPAPAPVVVAPPPVVATTTPSSTPVAPPPPPPPAPAPTVTTTTKTLPYATNIFDKSQGWNTYWGNFSIATDSLTIGAMTNGTNGGVLLDGTTAWSNYKFSATLNWVKGEYFGLYARYINSQNYTVCVFSEPYLGDIEINLEEHVDGKEYTMAQGNITNWNHRGGSNITASIEVQDSIGTCSLDNHTVSNYGNGNTLALPYSGKVGITAWDPSVNNSEIVVTSVSAKPNY